MSYWKYDEKTKIISDKNDILQFSEELMEDIKRHPIKSEAIRIIREELLFLNVNEDTFNEYMDEFKLLLETFRYKE